MEKIRVGAFQVRAWTDADGFLVVAVTDANGGEVAQVPHQEEQTAVGSEVRYAFTNHKKVISFDCREDYWTDPDGRTNSAALLEACKDPVFRRWWMTADGTGSYGRTPEECVAAAEEKRRGEATAGAVIATLKTAQLDKDKKRP